MKKITKKTKRIIAICILLSTAFSLVFFVVIPLSKKIFFISNKVALNVLSPEKIEFSIDFVYSDKLKENLVNFISDQTQKSKLLTFNPDNFYSVLKENFKIIKEIEWDFTQPNIAKLKVFGAKPFCKINGKFVLANKKRLFDLGFFENFELQNLKDIYVSSEFFDQKITKQAYALLKNLSSNVWEKYDIDYLKPSNIVLHSNGKNTKVGSSFIVDDKNILNDQKIDWAEKIGENLESRMSRKFSTKEFLNDLRFKNKIFVRLSDIKNRGRA